MIRTLANFSSCSVNASEIMSSESLDKSTSASTVCCTASSASNSVNEIPELHGSWICHDISYPQLGLQGAYLVFEPVNEDLDYFLLWGRGYAGRGRVRETGGLHNG